MKLRDFPQNQSEEAQFKNCVNMNLKLLWLVFARVDQTVEKTFL